MCVCVCVCVCMCVCVVEEGMPGEGRLRFEKEVGCNQARSSGGAATTEGLVLMVGSECDTVEKWTYEGQQGWRTKWGRVRRG